MTDLWKFIQLKESNIPRTVQGRYFIAIPQSARWGKSSTSFFLKFPSFVRIFPQIFFIFVLILVLPVGESPSREGFCYW